MPIVSRKQPSSVADGPREWPRQIAAATLPPLLALAVQSLLWSRLSPFSWSLFYPTIFISSWLGGFGSGIAATVLSTALVWAAFLAPHGEPRYVATTVLFIGTGIMFSIFNGRLRSARRAAEVALTDSQESNERLQSALCDRRIFAALIENSSDFIGIADPSGKPLYVNPAGRRIVNLPPDVAISDTTISEYYPPELRSFAGEVILKSMLETGKWEGETYFRDWQTDERIPVSDTHFLIRDPASGELLGMGTITRDITEIKRAREASELNRQLQHANEEVTRLYETARRAARARDDMLAIVAHDLRNPLGTIVLQTELLQRRIAKTDRRSGKPAETIGRAATRMNKLIQDLLDVTRMEEGRLPLDCARTPARDVLADALETHRLQATGAGVTITLDAPDSLPDIWADRDRLQQVFDNLLGNALKFTAHGGRIILRARPEDTDVVFSVTNTDGVAIPAEDVPHLFDRYWQGRKGHRLGAGLGLAIAKGIVEAHGGHIWVQSRPGSASTFAFTMPRVAEPGRAAPTRTYGRPLA